MLPLNKPCTPLPLLNLVGAGFRPALKPALLNISERGAYIYTCIISIHAHIYINIHMYIYICIRVCVCVVRPPPMIHVFCLEALSYIL